PPLQPRARNRSMTTTANVSSRGMAAMSKTRAVVGDRERTTARVTSFSTRRRSRRPRIRPPIHPEVIAKWWEARKLYVSFVSDETMSEPLGRGEVVGKKRGATAGGGVGAGTGLFCFT